MTSEMKAAVDSVEAKLNAVVRNVNVNVNINAEKCKLKQLSTLWRQN